MLLFPAPPEQYISAAPSLPFPHAAYIHPSPVRTGSPPHERQGLDVREIHRPDKGYPPAVSVPDERHCPCRRECADGAVSSVHRIIHALPSAVFSALFGHVCVLMSVHLLVRVYGLTPFGIVQAVSSPAERPHSRLGSDAVLYALLRVSSVHR